MRRLGRAASWRARGWAAPVATCAVAAAAVVVLAGGGPDPGCPADLTGDGHISSVDLNILLGAFGAAGPGDLDGSGAVTSVDLNLLLGAWGPCPVTGPCPGEGGCFASHGTPGCKDEACCSVVCAIDDFCCEVEWDAICVTEAFDLCGTCGDADAGGCCVPHGSPGCDHAECCQEVCIEDPFCCTVSWDGSCAEKAGNICAFCP